MSRTFKSGSPETVSASTKTLPIVVVLSTLLFVAVCAAGYFYYQYQQSPKVADAKEIAALKEQIGAVFLLPEGEEPTLATVTDREKLADQPFFQKAENGDKVLIYSNAGRAILYRPSTQKIVDVTAVNVTPPLASPEQPAEAAPTPEPAAAVDPKAVPVTVALYNGSTTLGVTTTVEAKLKTMFPLAAVIKKETAQRTDYTKTQVVDVSGKQRAVAEAMAALLGGTVGERPSTETDPGTDILVIVGNN